MHPLTCEWVDKAEGDFLTAGRELRARKSPIRYPGTSAEKAEAKLAYQTAVVIREFLRSRLGI